MNLQSAPIRILPGELECNINPQDFSSNIIGVTPTEEETMLGAAQLRRNTRALRGIVFQNSLLDEWSTRQPYDPDPAHALVERYGRVSYPYACEFGDAQLEIDEEVFCPTFTSASPFLLETVQAEFRPGIRMLDAFAGSGAFGINGALHGAESVAFDISPEAVACVQKNASLNSVSESVDARQGTLHECIAPGEKFDLITANPPLIPAEPHSPFETALFDPGLQTTKELIAALPKLLDKRGRCYILTSDVIDREGYKFDVGAACREAGLRMSVVAQLHKQYESYRVHRIEHRRLLIGDVLNKFVSF